MVQLLMPTHWPPDQLEMGGENIPEFDMEHRDIPMPVYKQLLNIVLYNLEKNQIDTYERGSLTRQNLFNQYVRKNGDVDADTFDQIFSEHDVHGVNELSPRAYRDFQNGVRRAHTEQVYNNIVSSNAPFLGSSVLFAMGASAYVLTARRSQLLARFAYPTGGLIFLLLQAHHTSERMRLKRQVMFLESSQNSTSAPPAQSSAKASWSLWS